MQYLIEIHFVSYAASNLTQLASQLPKLTPEMLLASMKQLQQQQAVAQQQQSLMQVYMMALCSTVACYMYIVQLRI